MTTIIYLKSSTVIISDQVELVEMTILLTKYPSRNEMSKSSGFWFIFFLISSPGAKLFCMPGALEILAG